MLDNLLTEGSQTKTSFWRRPEGTTGLLVLALLLVAGGIGFFMLLPWIIGLLASTLHAMFLLGAIAFILYCVQNRRIRTLVSFMFKSVVEKITSLFVTIDPIGILENYVLDVKYNIEAMLAQIQTMRGQMRIVKDALESSKQKWQASISNAKVAKDQARDAQFVLNARRAGRAKKSAITYQQLFTTMEKIYRVLMKMYDVAQVMSEDLVDEVETKKKERSVILVSYSAMKRAMSVIKGDADKKELFDLAMYQVVEDVGQRVGEMEFMIDMSRTFTESVDLQNGVFEAEALEVFEQWEARGTSLLLGEAKDALLLEAANEDNVLDLSIEPAQREKVPVARKEKKAPGKFDQLLM